MNYLSASYRGIIIQRQMTMIHSNFSWIKLDGHTMQPWACLLSTAMLHYKQFQVWEKIIEFLKLINYLKRWIIINTLTNFSALNFSESKSFH